MDWKKYFKSSKKETTVRGQAVRAVIEFLIIALILFAVGGLVHLKINEMLDQSLEESLRKHIKTLAYSVESQFNQELGELRDGALMVKQKRLAAKDLIDVANIQGQGSRIGIIRDDGQLLAGDPLPRFELEQFYKVFRGGQLISYDNKNGLLFAVPTTIDGRRCAYYETYGDDEIKEEFGVYFYDGDGIIMIGYKNGDWTDLSYSVNDIGLYHAQAESPEFQHFFRQNITDILNDSERAIARYEYEGKDYFTFGIKTLYGDFALYGCVPHEAISVGVEYVHTAMLFVFGLMILVLFGVGRYLLKSIEANDLQQQKILADRANKTKSEFLSNVSHEIRTPINAILGMDEMILRESNDATILEYAENIHSASNNLLGLVNDILDFSKIEAGKMEIIPVDYQLSSVLNDLINMINARAEKKGLQFIAKASHDLPTLLHGDEIRIKQVVTNILTNAVKYTEAGSVTLTVDFEKLADDKILLRFSIKDTGIGIKPEDLPKLFNAFERIEEKRNRTIEGTGLGMNITQQLLRLMNSKLEVESVYGKGSTFSFALEQRVISWEPLGDFEEAFRHSLTQRKKYREKFTAPNAKILVVDDTVMNLTVVKGLLKKTKIQIKTAESGYECLDMTAREHFDIIFLDHRMPGLDGIETLHEMRSIRPSPNDNTPVVALTANAISGAREQYLAAGFDSYLTKPVDPSALETLIIKLLPPELVEDASDETAEPVEEALNLPEWLMSINEINAREGVKHCGSEEDYLAALKVFAEAIESNADEIEKFFRAEDWKNYTTKVHALKSTARVIGAAELSERAKRMEDAGNSGYFEEIAESTAPLLELYRSFAKKLSPLIEKSSDDDSDKPLIGEDELAEAIEALREMSASFDYDSVMFVLESLDEYRLPDEQLDRFKKIRAAVSNLDWEAVQAALQ